MPGCAYLHARRLHATGILLLLGALVLTAVPAVADEDPPLGPVEEQGFLRKEGDQQPKHPAGGSGATPAGGPRSATVSAAAERLEGLFKVAAGECPSGEVTAGSYFRMVQPGGSVNEGPFVENNDSPCGDNTYTPLEPGTQGGLSTTGYQPQNEPPFDATGNGTSDKIVQPARFFGTFFAAATNQVDPQTSVEVSIPAVTNDGGTLSGDTRAFAASWNNQHFNQGSPKPDGGASGLTAGPTGSFDAGSKAYTLRWSSTIVGGPFNNFTGVWHLAGTFDGNTDVGVPQVPSQGGAGGTGGNPSVGASGTTAGGGIGSTGPTARTGPADLATSATGAGLVALAGLWRWAALNPSGTSRRRKRRS